MDVRPGGLWHHVMRVPDGHELHMNFVFIDVDKPNRLAWRNAGNGEQSDGPPSAIITVTCYEPNSATSGDIVYAWFLTGPHITLASPDATTAFSRKDASNLNRLSVHHGYHWKNRSLRDVVRHRRLADRGMRTHPQTAQ
jgi:uncharacterized protein YndB with AHSA1/START domain